jgi:hypothetical protein
MFFWYVATMLAVESIDVVGARLQRLAAGGSEAWTEAHLMVSEKADAAFEATATLVAGGTPAEIIERYREHVASNAARLRI